ncbi:MAG TPA: hypothetical protein VIW92_07625 [Thermoanaerobaculia bacterium]
MTSELDNRAALSRIVRAGLLTGVTDGLFASVLSVAFYDSTVTRLFQGVATTLLGPAALDGGIKTAAVGVLMHFGVALGWSAVFLFLLNRSSWIRGLLRSRYGVLKVATLYGPFIWIVMSLVVIPLLLHRPPAITGRWWVQLIGHIPFVGLPIVWSIGKGYSVSEAAGGDSRGRLSFLLVLGLASGILSSCTHASVGVPAAGAQPASDGDCHRVESERFVFHSDPWINLHHFLFEWARNVPERQPGDRRRAVEVTERTQLGDLGEGEQRTWGRAVGFYRERLIANDLLFNQQLIALRGQLAAIACSAGGPENIDTELRTVLVEAMPVYRRHWWPEHHTANTAWIREQLDKLKSHETVLAERLAQAYGGEWPPERIRVDVVAYASWSGGYTTNRPNHVTISGASYKGLQGLEILFHEVSHASFFEQRILGQLAAAFRQHGADPPDGLSHVIQFVTPPELLRSLLSGEELDGYRSVSERVYERGSSRDEYRIVLKHWKPFLDGKVQRAEALDRIAAELASQNDAE